MPHEKIQCCLWLSPVSIVYKPGRDVSFFRCATHLYYSHLLGSHYLQMATVKGFEIRLSPHQVVGYCYEILYMRQKMKLFGVTYATGSLLFP
jgi:hypothetical protein